MGHLEDVPQELRADWARAHVDVFEEVERAQEAQDEGALERGLKWYLVLHDVLLRGLQRGTCVVQGGRRMSSVTASAPLVEPPLAHTRPSRLSPFLNIQYY